MKAPRLTVRLGAKASENEKMKSALRLRDN